MDDREETIDAMASGPEEVPNDSEETSAEEHGTTEDLRDDAEQEIEESGSAEPGESEASADSMSDPADGEPVGEAEEADEDEEAEADDEEEGELAEDAGDEEAEQENEEEERDWYVLKVQSNRENSIREAIWRRLKMAELEEYVTDIVVPTEKVTEIKDGKKRVVTRKFYPGYVMIKLAMNEEVWFEIRNTPGVGHFVGSGDRPLPMAPHEVDRMLGRVKEVETAQPRINISFQKGDRVKIKNGPFENFEGYVEDVLEEKGLVQVMLQIFGRPTPVDLQYWEVEAV